MFLASVNQPNEVSTGSPDAIGPLPVGLPIHQAVYDDLAVHYAALMRALREGDDVTAFGLSLHHLILVTRRHFSAEESVMADSGYPGLDDHVAEHRKLLACADDFLYSVTHRFTKADCHAVASYFKYWLRDHARRCDQDFTRFAAARRLSG
jgi:hemerythrin-like metal-binding protein